MNADLTAKMDSSAVEVLHGAVISLIDGNRRSAVLFFACVSAAGLLLPHTHTHTQAEKTRQSHAFNSVCVCV